MGEAMKSAFQSAGYTTAKDRLREVAIKCMIENADSLEKAQEAIWLAVQSSAAMLSEMARPYREEMTAAVIRRLQSEAEHDGFASKKPRPRERAALTIVSDLTSKRAAANRAEWKQREEAEWVDRCRREDERDRRREALYKTCRLWLFHIDGVAIGEKTASQVAAWADTQDTDVAFARRIIAGIPLNSTKPVRNFVTPEEADRAWVDVKA